MRQILPTLIIIALQLRRLQREARGPNHAAGFEHEGHRIFDAMDLAQIRIACLRENFRIGPVAAHAVVQARATGRKAGRLGIVHAVDQAHEFAGDIAMEPRWAEGVFHRQDARGKYHEVDRINAGCVALRLQH